MKRDHHSKVSELEEKIKNFKVPNNYVKKLIAAETYKWWKWWYALYVVLDNFWMRILNMDQNHSMAVMV